MIVEGRSGKKTTLSFKLTRLASSILGSTSALDPTTGIYKGLLKVETTAEEGLHRLERLDTLGRIADPTGAPLAVSPNEDPYDAEDAVTFYASDLEGSSSRIEISGLRTGQWQSTEKYLPISTVGFTNAVRTPEGYLAGGSYASPILDAHSSILPGAQMRIGPLADPVTHLISTFPVTSVTTVLGEETSGPVVPSVLLARVEVRLVQGDSPDLSGGAATTLVSGDVSYNGNALVMPTPASNRLIVKRFLRLEAVVTPYPVEGILGVDCAQYDSALNFCSRGRRRQAGVQSVGGPLYGILYSMSDDPQYRTVVAGGVSGQTIPLGDKVSLSDVATDEFTIISVALGSGRAEPGHKALPPDTVFDLRIGPPPPQPVTFNFNFDPGSLTSGQQNAIRVNRLEEPSGETGLDLPRAVVSGSVTFQVAGNGRYMIMRPVYAEPARFALTGIEVYAGVPTITLRTAEKNESAVRNALDRLLAQGKALVSRLFELGPSDTTLAEAMAVKILCDPGACSGSPVPIQFSGDGFFEILSDIYINRISGSAMGTTGGIHSFFGVFVDTPPFVVDRLAPITEIAFEGPVSTSGAGSYLISTRTFVRFDAQDRNEEGLTPSGVARTYYLAAGVFVDTATTPGQEYSAPFALAGGNYNLTYYSVDRAGNYESPKSVQIEVQVSTSTGGGGPPPPGGGGGGGGEQTPGRGLAISADSQGGLWMVLQDTSSAISLAKFSSTGVFEGGIPLPGAGDFGAWRIGFDDQGNAVAAGSIMGNTTGPDVAVYRVSPEGALLSTATFDAGLGGADIAMDASGDLWVAGAVQTGGESEADMQAQLALWRYTPQDGLKLKSLYAGPGGLDAGFGVRLDASGNVWIVGFSSNPATPGPNKLDLALWKYEATGSSLTAGPFRKPGYARGIGETTNAKLSIFNGSIFLSAGRLNEVGDMTLATAKHDLSGAEIWSRSWNSNPAADDLPSAILSSVQGLSVVGGVFRGQDRPLAVWRYSLDGTLYSAETSSGVGKANDAAANSEGTWLAVEGRGAPFKFTGGTALPGSGDGQATQDTLPPRTTLVVGEPKSGADPIVISTFTSLGFTAVDDLASVDDGLGSGVRETLYLVDIDPQSCDGIVQVSTAPRGTCANPVYGSTFTLTAGTHTIAYLSRDNAGNEEAPQQKNFSVNLVFAAPGDMLAPRTALAVGTPKFGTEPVFVATRTPLGFVAVDDLAAVGDGAGTVARTYFSVNGSSFSVFAGTFSLAGDGSKGIRFYSVDSSSNAEVVKLTTVTVDGTAPVTSPLINGLPATSETLSSTDSISFTATDAGSGVKQTFHALDFGEPSSSTAPFTLAPGTHTLQFMSVDNLDNEETIQAVALTVLAPDAAAPSLALTPPSGSTVTTARPLIRADYSDAGRGIDAASVRLELDGVDVTTQSAVTSSSAAYSSGTDLAQGTHTLSARVLDLAGNEATANSRFFIDSIAPATTLLKNGQPAAGAVLVAISTDAFGFAAADTGTGVAEIRFTLDAGTEQVFASTFTLSAGTRELRFFAVDRAGNREAARTVTVEVSGPDTQGPSLTFSLTAGATIAAAAPVLSVAYFDAAGVDAATVRFFLDGVDVTTQAAVTASSASFTPSGALSQGAHEVAVSARDLNGNLAQASAMFYIDSIAPATQLLGLGTYTVHGALLVTQAGSSLTLTAQDPVVNGFATGVAATYYLVDSQPQDCPGGSIAACPESAFTAPFALANGTHTVSYASKDNAGNLETVKTAAAAADGEGPAVLIQSPLAGEGYRALSSTVPVRFAVTDDFDPAPVFAAVLVQLEDRGTPRGVRPALVAVTQGDDLSPQSLDDGLWQLRVSATDFVLNSRTAASGAFEIIHDVLPPRTSLLIGEPKDGTAPVFVATGTRLGLEAVDDLLAAGDAAGLGVERTFYSVDGGSFAVFSASFTLASEGPRILRFYSLDRSSNTEAVRTSTVTVDATAPVTALRVNGQAAPAGTLVLVTTDAVSLAATDAGAGVRETRYALDGGPESVSTAPFNLAEGTHTLTFFSLDRVGNREAEKTAALTVSGLDTTAPATALEIGQPKFGTAPIFVSSSTRFGLTASEPGRIFYSIGGEAFQVFAGSFTISGEGVRTLSWYGEDSAGNRETTRTATVYADATAPITALAVNGTSVAGGLLNLALGDVLALSSTDTASGVREVGYSLDGVAFQVYGGTFTLAEGQHTLKFRAQDQVLNQEQDQTVAVQVVAPSGDTTPPSLGLACPGVEGGICSVFKETVFVRGRVFDLGLARYRLEAGGVLISSGTNNTEGMLGVWDVFGLAGAQTLILTGEDLAGNSATLTRPVFVGEPARLLVFGGKKEMGQPQGVAVDNARGIVYVANTNKGEIRLYNLGGEFIKAYPDYRHPRAVAVDEGGNLYIAESGKDRIVKVGPLGNPLWTKGKSGRGPLEFRDPSGIAAKGGKVAISDTRNRRVQVLDENGIFLNEFPITERTEALVADDGDEDDEPENPKGVPVGIALDDLGRIYVADAKNKKGLAYDAQGVLIREFGGPGNFRRPEGIAVSTSGECVFVSDRKKDRITKFDGEGRIVLNFGNQGNISGKRTVPVETVFRRPIGLHLDAAGTLWVADRNNEVIQRFGLPGALTAGSPGGGGFRVTDEEQSSEKESQASLATEEFYLREAYAIPNPCKGCGSQGFVVQVGLADSVNLECRNVMGRVVYQNAFPSPTLKDTGNGRGPQYAYEQHWPMSGVGTGIYACTMTARKAGKSEIRKVVRTAVIR